MLRLSANEYVAGNTKMFLKAGTLNKLRVMREQKIYGGSQKMQVGYSGCISRARHRGSSKHCLIARVCVFEVKCARVPCQAVVRGMIARKQFRILWEEEQERKRRAEEERKRR